MARLHRLAIAAAAAALLAAWGASRVASAGRAGQWRAVLGDEGPAAAETLGPPPASADMQRLARYRVDSRMPPDYDGAESLIADALRRAPLRSSLWIDLARIRLFRGDADGARVALARADALDPGWPAQRLESSRLWFLLGDDQRGMELAASVADWDDESLVDAVESLCQSGFSPAEAWTRLAAQRSPSEAALAKLLGRLHSRDDAAMAALWRVLPQASIAADPSLRSAAANIFADPLVPQALESLWRTRADGQLAAILDSPRVLAENPRLTSDPRRWMRKIDWVENPNEPPPKLGWLDALRAPKKPPELGLDSAEAKFPLGWRPFPENVWVWTAYEDPAPGQNHGVLELYISGQSNAAKTGIAWQLCTLMVAPGEQPVVLTLPTATAPRGLSIVRLLAFVGREEVASSRDSDWSSEEWQALSVVVPPSQDYRLVTLVMQRRVRDTESTESPRIRVGGVAASLQETPEP